MKYLSMKNEKGEEGMKYLMGQIGDEVGVTTPRLTLREKWILQYYCQYQFLIFP
jgi:hypothetical protein